ncbi:sugar phosphate isomerase/epimerase family protein [Nocardia blacklockiae]|uniref:sugar phosphate isomerase/epimerase family protein n=1 Tax=Nocardia blacklockiae TaxID=480036 RepID=UPI0018960AFC|nr:sugar phosphate isomerase/epimerase family protein [Nocardia blacklockiae]MBF6175806.1 sugar phosphate isomerase/epimerase [Nocardia blacklockiae]
MSPMPFAYSVNQFTTTPWSFEEDVAHYTEAGVEVIEVCQEKLDPDRGGEQLAAAVAAGLSIQSVQPSVRTMIPSAGQPEPKELPERIAAFRRCVELVAPFAPGAAFVTNTGPAPEGDMVEATARTVSSHRELAAIAADHGVRIALEPLNPVSLNQETAIWTLRQALDIVEEIDRADVGLCFDTWNLWQDGHVRDSLRAAGDRIILLQVSDWRTPRSSADRRNIGTGAIPTGELLHAVYDTGYRGPCVLEILSVHVSDSVYDTDLDEVLRTNRAALNKSWHDD